MASRTDVQYSLRKHNYDKPETAKYLGIGVSSLYRKLEEFDIPKDKEPAKSDEPAATTT